MALASTIPSPEGSPVNQSRGTHGAEEAPQRGASAAAGPLAAGNETTQRVTRGKRKVSYDETRRRSRRRHQGSTPVYLERGNGRGTKRKAILIGPAAISSNAGHESICTLLDAHVL